MGSGARLVSWAPASGSPIATHCGHPTYGHSAIAGRIAGGRHSISGVRHELLSQQVGRRPRKVHRLDNALGYARLGAARVHCRVRWFRPVARQQIARGLGLESCVVRGGQAHFSGVTQNLPPARATTRTRLTPESQSSARTESHRGRSPRLRSAARLVLPVRCHLRR